MRHAVTSPFHKRPQHWTQHWTRCWDHTYPLREILSSGNAECINSPTMRPNAAPMAIVGVKSPATTGSVMVTTQQQKIVIMYSAQAYLQREWERRGAAVSCKTVPQRDAG